MIKQKPERQDWMFWDYHDIHRLPLPEEEIGRRTCIHGSTLGRLYRYPYSCFAPTIGAKPPYPRGAWCPECWQAVLAAKGKDWRSYRSCRQVALKTRWEMVELTIERGMCSFIDPFTGLPVHDPDRVRRRLDWEKERWREW